jgi:hypothetical protein
MKGLALPVELLIVLIVAVVILLAVILFYYGVWRGTGTIDVQAALGRACLVVNANGCVINDAKDKEVTGVDLDKSGGPPWDTVSFICGRASLSLQNCFKQCGCNF